MFKNQAEMINSLYREYETLVIKDTTILYKVINCHLHQKSNVKNTNWELCELLPDYTQTEIFNAPNWFDDYLDKKPYDGKVCINPILCWVQDDRKDVESIVKEGGYICVVSTIMFEEGDLVFYIDECAGSSNQQ